MWKNAEARMNINVKVGILYFQRVSMDESLGLENKKERAATLIVSQRLLFLVC
jgi:hypothetical protein